MIIGLTGGIASGKSTVAKIFKQKGALVLDADAIAHKVIEPGNPAYKKIVRYFGAGVVNRDRTINRGLLAKIVFFSPDKLKKLNSIIHPLVIRIIKDEIEKRKRKKVIIIDAPLLIETELHRGVDMLIVVRSSRSIQLKRLREKGFSLKEARTRIDSQMPLKKKVKLADVVIDGALRLKDLRKKVNHIWQSFRI